MITRGFLNNNIITRGYGLSGIIDHIIKPVRIFFKNIIKRFFNDNYIQHTFVYEYIQTDFMADKININFFDKTIQTHFIMDKRILTFYECRPARR